MTPVTEGRRRVRVLFVANDPPESAVRRYRCDNLAAALPPERFAAEVVTVGMPNVLVDHDIVVLHRICTVREGRQYAAAARACGAVLVYGADDLVWDADALTAALASDPAKARLARYAPLHAEMLRLADAVLVSTESLADRARAVCRPEQTVCVARNFLSDELLRLSEAARQRRVASGRVTLGYLSGTPTHDADLAVIAPVLRETLAAFPEADLLLAGPVRTPPELAPLEAAGRIRRAPFVPWRELPGVLAGIDINLAPLDLTSALNHGKSEIKLLEAAAVGVPTIASASAGFREALRAVPEAGVLAATDEEWRDALAQLIDNPARRAQAGLAASRFVAARGGAAANRDAVTEIFDRIAGLGISRPAVTRATRVGSPFDPKHIAKRLFRRVRAARRIH